MGVGGLKENKQQGGFKITDVWIFMMMMMSNIEIQIHKFYKCHTSVFLVVCLYHSYSSSHSEVVEGMYLSASSWIRFLTSADMILLLTWGADAGQGGSVGLGLRSACGPSLRSTLYWG